MLFPSKLAERLKRPFNRTAEVDTSGRISITPRQIYIVPTRFGLVFAIMLVAMLVGSNNYEINLGFVLTFLLAGIGHAVMLQSWRNLSRLEITPVSVASVFCGDTAKFVVVLHNNRPINRSAIQLMIDNDPSMLDLAANSKQQIICNKTATHRGYLSPDRWTVFSFFPTNLFYCWAYFNTNQQCIVYPRPIDHTIPISQLFESSFLDQFDQINQTDSLDFFGHRKHQPGDSLKHIDWKALARSRGKLTKQFNNVKQDDVWIRWEHVKAPDIEEKLSVLSRAVLQLTNINYQFGLSIPGTAIEPDTGKSHQHTCLTALAVFEQ